AWTKITGHPSDVIRPVSSSLAPTVAPRFGLSITRPASPTPAPPAGGTGPSFACEAARGDTGPPSFEAACRGAGPSPLEATGRGAGPPSFGAACGDAGSPSFEGLRSRIVATISEAAATAMPARTRLVFIARPIPRGQSEARFGSAERTLAGTGGEGASGAGALVGAGPRSVRLAAAAGAGCWPAGTVFGRNRLRR